MARVFYCDGRALSVGRDGDWLLVGVDPPDGPAFVTDRRRLTGQLDERLGALPGGPRPAVTAAAAEILTCIEDVPAVRRAGEDGRPATSAAAVDWMLDAVPELSPLVEEHLAYHGELLVTVVFDDFGDAFARAVLAGEHDVARRFCEAVEGLLGTSARPNVSDRAWNLTHGSFVEIIVGNRDVQQRAARWLGPVTQQEIRDLQQRWHVTEASPD